MKLSDLITPEQLLKLANDRSKSPQEIVNDPKTAEMIKEAAPFADVIVKMPMIERDKFTAICCITLLMLVDSCIQESTAGMKQ